MKRKERRNIDRAGTQNRKAFENPGRGRQTAHPGTARRKREPDPDLPALPRPQGVRGRSRAGRSGRPQAVRGIPVGNGRAVPGTVAGHRAGRQGAAPSGQHEKGQHRSALRNPAPLGPDPPAHGRRVHLLRRNRLAEENVLHRLRRGTAPVRIIPSSGKPEDAEPAA